MYLCFVFLMLLCLFIAALWSLAGKGLYVMCFFCIFVTFPCGILGHVCYLFVSFPDLCPLSYFVFLFNCLSFLLLFVVVRLCSPLICSVLWPD